MKKSISIVGGGPSALMTAAFLDSSKFDVTLYEKNKSVGRKFLVAGDGGFNITHSESIEEMIERFTPIEFLKEALTEFSNEDLRTWLEELGIPTFEGSSHRVYPEEGIKPIEVLNAILKKLDANGTTIKTEHTWTGWNKDALVFNDSTNVKSDYTIFALGGGSWKVTGSDGSWSNLFEEKNIEMLPFTPANCAYKVDWTKGFLGRNAGKPLKNISMSCFGNEQKGEAVITEFGLEGNAIYALSPQIQELLEKKGEATVLIDLKPTLTMEVLLEKMYKARVPKTTDILRKYVKLGPSKLDLLKLNTTREEFMDINSVAKKVKALPVTLTAAASLDEAISTTGGIALTELNENYELSKLPNNFCIGEMSDWNAPTGGYLLQACFSMGSKIGHHLNSK